MEIKIESIWNILPLYTVFVELADVKQAVETEISTTVLTRYVIVLQYYRK